MKLEFQNPTAEIFVPDGRSGAKALSRITHLGIGAHADDLEFMAFHGIAKCFGSRTKWFGGVTCADGAGSARAGKFKKFSDAQMKAIRRAEQNAAARIGKYGAMIQLDFSSARIKNANDDGLKTDLKRIISAARPKIIYTHNPADKHETHVAVGVAVIAALRELPRALRPKKMLGCEVWRDLDWLPDEKKVVMDVSGHSALARKLNGVFKSQLAGGKRYDLAVMGRRAANATFFDAHKTDAATQIIFGMDLTPLIQDDARDVKKLVGELIEEFRADAMAKLKRFL